MDDLNGQTIRGYELHEQVGEGGFGAVYRAFQPLLKREVAIKVILPRYANEPDFIRRFEVEAELVARLEHPHIVPLFDYWREPDSAYLVMRLLRGGSLKEILSRDTFSLEHIADILDQIAAALHVAHRNNIVHRDIKPANILLDEDDNAYLTDFGIAKSADVRTSSEDEGITGSLQYAAPELLQSQRLSPQTDIYALGFVLYEMLAGEHPYEGDTVTGMIFKHIQEPLPDIGDVRDDVPSTVNDIIQTSTAKVPADRYADVRDMAREFRAAISASDAIIHPPSIEAIEDDGAYVDLPNPYLGLRAFQEADAERFFGRAELVERLLSRLAQPEAEARFLAVVGPSGSGKSSVVKAGLLPTLRQGQRLDSGNWFITEMFPGTYPFEELEAALLKVAISPPESLINQLREDERGLVRAVKRILPSDESELVLVIDQFEELFTLIDNDEIRELFLDNLLAIIEDNRSRLRVIVTLRADFYDRPLQYREFGELLRKRTEVILPMSSQELQDAIIQPAEGVGAQLQSGLVDAIIKDVKEQPGMLPLLQYALTELFERRVGRTLTLNAYQAIGGVTGALARRAEELYLQMDGDGQTAVRQLFLRLVTLGEGTEDTRRRVRQSEVADQPQMQAVLMQYGQYRLLTFDRDPLTRGPTVEVAHEALIRTWERLRDWVDHRRDYLRIHRRLSVATTEWMDAGESSGFLARDARLEQFETWTKTTDIALNADEERYLQTSMEAESKREQLEAERQAHEIQLEQSAKNRLRLFVVSLVAAIVGIGLAFLAFQQSIAAQTAQGTAESIGNTAVVQVTAVIEAQRQAETAAAVAAFAQRTSAANADAAIANLNEANAQGTRAAEQQATAESAAATAVAAGATSQFQVTEIVAAQEEALENLDVANVAGTEAANQQEVAEVAAAIAVAAQATSESNAEASRSLAFAGSASDFLGQNSPLALFFAIEANLGIEEAEPLARRVLSLAVFSSPRMRLEAGAPVTSVIFLPLTADATSETDENPIPAGLQAVSGTTDGTILLWNIREYTAIPFNNNHNGTVNDMALNPIIPELLVSVGDDGVGILWTIGETGGVEARQLVSDNSNVPARAVAFDSTGTRIAIGYANGNVVLFDVFDGRQVRQLPQVSIRAVNSIAFLPRVNDRSNLNDMVIAFDDATRYWDDSGNNGNGILIPFDSGDIFAVMDKVQDVTFSDDSNFVLTSESDVGNRPQLWEIDVNNADSFDNNVTPLRLPYPVHLGQVTSVTYSSRGELIVSTAADGTVFLVDAESGQLVRRLLAHEASVLDAAFSDDRRFILTAGADQVLYLWDVNTTIGNEVAYDGVGSDDIMNGAISQVRFTEDGGIFAGSDRGEVALWTYENFEPDFNARLVDVQIPQVIYNLIETTGELGFPVMRLLTGSLDMRLYDVASGAIIAQYDREEATAFVNDIAITRDSRFAVWAGGYFERIEARDSLARDIRIPILALWDTETGELVRDLDVTDTQEIAATPAPEETPTDNNVESNQQVDNSITAVAIHPDGEILVSGDENGEIIIWELFTGNELMRLEGHTDIITVLRFDENGTQLLSGSTDRLITLWIIEPDVTDSFQAVRFIGHTDAINDVDFNPNDEENTIVSGSEDRRIILWDSNTGEILQILGEQSSPITTVQFTPDGFGVVFGTLDGRVLFKGVDTAPTTIEWAENNRYILPCEALGQRADETESCSR